MTVDFFEGPAGTGKTHQLIERARELVGADILGEKRRLLALTFMNGARRRLQSRLTGQAAFRRRFECQTIDVFARRLVGQRGALLHRRKELVERAARLNAFDGPCLLAGGLLAQASVAQWVAASYPLVLVDEAQDVDLRRLSILQGLAQHCHVVAAADAFQCLKEGQDTQPVITWLESAGSVTRLRLAQRTTQQGLLEVASALRDDRDIWDVLVRSVRSNWPTWSGEGFRIVECPTETPPLMASMIANDIVQRTGPVAILTPDGKNPRIRAAIDAVRSRTWQRKNSDVTFGQYRCEWEVADRAVSDALVAELGLDERVTYEQVVEALTAFSHEPAIGAVLGRLDYVRRTQGMQPLTGSVVEELVHEAVRNQSRFGMQRVARYPVMTIPRAKNREFANVIVLWPYTAAGGPEHLRRLLYNGITRAMVHCTVIVFGKDRLATPPFTRVRYQRPEQLPLI